MGIEVFFKEFSGFSRLLDTQRGQRRVMFHRVFNSKVFGMISPFSMPDLENVMKIVFRGLLFDRRLFHILLILIIISKIKQRS